MACALLFQGLRRWGRWPVARCGQAAVRVGCGALVLAAWCWGLSAGAWAAGRVASLNLCADQLVLQLADRADIIGLTPLARDCTESVLCDQAKQVPVLPAKAETVLAAHPSVLLASPYSARLAVRAAREAGAKVVMLPPASSLADVPVQIMRVAQAVGQVERGHQLVAAFEARLAALSIPLSPTGPVAAVYEANGLVVHAGSLPNDILTHAGLRNFATVTGMGQVGGRVPLEVLLVRRPDLLVRDKSGPGQSVAQAMLDNPVLLAAFPPPHVADVPARLWLCGLPQTMDALALLRAARDRLVAPKEQP